jgi:hypothetical protein
MNVRVLRCAIVTSLSIMVLVTAAWADGSVFITGHDPDFHATLGGNVAGAQAINQTAIGYVMDPAFNPYVAGGANKFLFVESSIAPPSGHTVGLNGIVASGYTLGTSFDHADASTLNAALNQLGTTYGALVVASDFGGVLTQAELDILNSRANDIYAFVNSGGGIYAMAESNLGMGLTPNGGQFGFLPTVTSAVAANQSEQGFTVSAFGASLGLTNADVNGNASHCYFTYLGALDAVDYDAAGRIISAAGRIAIPEPTASLLLGLGLMLMRRRG